MSIQTDQEYHPFPQKRPLQKEAGWKTRKGTGSTREQER